MCHSNIDVVVIGRSEKFVEYVKAQNVGDIFVVGWRSLDVFPKEHPKKIYIVGFDYGLYTKSLNKFYKANVINPLRYIKKIATSDCEIIYIDTKHTDKSKTCSRYKYAKNQLGYWLQRYYHHQLKVYAMPTIVSENGDVLMNCNSIEKNLFNISVKFGLIEAISLKEVYQRITAIDFDEIEYKKMRGVALFAARPIFIDRLLRVICG